MTPDDLGKVYRLAYGACTMWSDLGLELGLKWDALEIIKKNNPKNVKDCLKEMLSMWLRTNPTLEDLAKALEQEHIALPDVARKVCQGFESTIGQLTFIPNYNMYVHPIIIV